MRRFGAGFYLRNLEMWCNEQTHRNRNTATSDACGRRCGKAAPLPTPHTCHRSSETSKVSANATNVVYIITLIPSPTSTFQAPSLYASASLLIVLFEVLAKFRFKEGFGPFGCLNYVVV